MISPQGVFGTPARAALAIAKFRAAYRDWDENEEEREEQEGVEMGGDGGGGVEEV